MFFAVFLRSHKSLESVDPQFTMRRKMEQLREELELMEQLREVQLWTPAFRRSRNHFGGQDTVEEVTTAVPIHSFIFHTCLSCTQGFSWSLRAGCQFITGPVVFGSGEIQLTGCFEQWTSRFVPLTSRVECLFLFFLPQSIESRLKVVLPEDLGSSLMDGVVLCHLANHIRPRSVASIHVPSPAVV